MDSLFGFIVVIAIIISAVNKSKKQQKSQDAQNAMKRRQAVQTRTTAAASTAAAHAAAPAAPAAATVLPVSELRPSIQVTKHTDDIFAGSMNAETMEGYDPCHELGLREAVNPCELAPDEQPTEAAPALALEWNGSALVKAMVMQEVLTRPCDRVRR